MAIPNLSRANHGRKRSVRLRLRFLAVDFSVLCVAVAYGMCFPIALQKDFSLLPRAYVPESGPWDSFVATISEFGVGGLFLATVGAVGFGGIALVFCPAHPANMRGHPWWVRVGHRIVYLTIMGVLGWGAFVAAIWLLVRPTL
jgi:hypothetical protein